MTAPLSAATTAEDEPRLSRGETKRFASELVEQQPRMRIFARRLLRDPVAAEDLVQETMLRAWAARDRFTLGTSMAAWLYVILKRTYLTQLRRPRIFAQYDEETEHRVAAAESQTAAVLLTEVNEAMGRLDSDQRTALAMVAIEGQSYEETSRLLGVPIGTVKSRVARARQALIAVFDNTHLGRTEGEARENTPRAAHDEAQGEAIRIRWRTAKKLSLSFLIG